MTQCSVVNLVSKWCLNFKHVVHSHHNNFSFQCPFITTLIIPISVCLLFGITQINNVLLKRSNFSNKNSIGRSANTKHRQLRLVKFHILNIEL